MVWLAYGLAVRTGVADRHACRRVLVDERLGILVAAKDPVESAAPARDWIKGRKAQW
jgi:hypothetical protein